MVDCYKVIADSKSVVGYHTMCSGIVEVYSEVMKIRSYSVLIVSDKQ